MTPPVEGSTAVLRRLHGPGPGHPGQTHTHFSVSPRSRGFLPGFHHFHCCCFGFYVFFDVAALKKKILIWLHACQGPLSETQFTDVLGMQSCVCSSPLCLRLLPGFFSLGSVNTHHGLTLLSALLNVHGTHMGHLNCSLVRISCA